MKFQMKHYIRTFLMVLLIGTLLSGCSTKENAANSSNTDTNTSTNTDKISIVTTVFPAYDWVRELTKGNDDVEITMLLDSGVDLHSYQPTVEDMLAISNCDLFVYVGGESDEWVEDALDEAENENMQVVNLVEVLGNAALEEEIVEGMEHEHEEDEEEHDEALEEEHEHEIDEHVWLSLRNAEVFCEDICQKLETIDEANTSLYEENKTAYLSSLEALDANYVEAVDAGNVKTILCGDRFPFRYLAEDYGLEYYAAFSGCSAESEASFETITFLAGKVDELGLHAIVQTESADGKIAQTIQSSTKAKDQQIITLDSMQSATAKDVADGKTYLETMQQNLDALTQALTRAE